MSRCFQRCGTLSKEQWRELSTLLDELFIATQVELVRVGGEENCANANIAERSSDEGCCGGATISSHPARLRAASSALAHCREQRCDGALHRVQADFRNCHLITASLAPLTEWMQGYDAALTRLSQAVPHIRKVVLQSLRETEPATASDCRRRGTVARPSPIPSAGPMTPFLKEFRKRRPVTRSNFIEDACGGRAAIHSTVGHATPLLVITTGAGHDADVGNPKSHETYLQGEMRCHRAERCLGWTSDRESSALMGRAATANPTLIHIIAEWSPTKRRACAGGERSADETNQTLADGRTKT